jgi:hypothetical protein
MIIKLYELSPTRSRGEIDQKPAEKWQQQDTTNFQFQSLTNTTTGISRLRLQYNRYTTNFLPAA